MRARTAEEIQGFEYDWLACDGTGHVALLSTAGGGYPPSAFLAEIDAYDRAIEGVKALPASTEAKMAPKIVSGLPNTWEDVAHRGLFSFDADALGGPYRLVGVPVRPITVDQLPKAIADVVRWVELKTVQFATARAISREDIVISENRA